MQDGCNHAALAAFHTVQMLECPVALRVSIGGCTLEVSLGVFQIDPLSDCAQLLFCLPPCPCSEWESWCGCLQVMMEPLLLNKDLKTTTYIKSAVV